MAKKIILRVVPGEAMDPETLEVVHEVRNEAGKLEPLASFKYRPNFIGMLSQAPNEPGGGMDYEAMVANMDLIDKLRTHKDGDEVILEDEEWRRLRDRLKRAKFTFASKTIIEMIKHVDEAEVCKKLAEVKPEVVKAPPAAEDLTSVEA